MKKLFKFFYFHYNDIMEFYTSLTKEEFDNVMTYNYLGISHLHRTDGPASITYTRKNNIRTYLHHNNEYFIAENESFLDGEEIINEDYYLNGSYVGSNLKIYNSEQLQNYLLLQ